MSDIVWRIRTRLNDAPMPTERLLDDAADEIERLRAENKFQADALKLLEEAMLGLQAMLKGGPVFDAADFERRGNALMAEAPAHG